MFILPSLLPGLTVMVLILGCGAGAKVKPSKLAAERLQTVAKAHSTDREFVIRWNPALCEVPAFEVRLSGTWYRAFVDGLEDVEGPAVMARERLAELDSQGQGTSHLLVLGELSTGLQEAPTRAHYLVLEIVRICPESGCSSLEEEN